MHLVCRFGSYEEFEKVFQPLSGMQRVVIFRRQTALRTTPIMRLLANGSIHDSSAIEKCLELIFRKSSHSEARDLLSMTDNQGNVIAHAAQWNCPQAIAYLLSLVECEPKKQLELMNVSWRCESDKSSFGGESGFSDGNEEPPSPAERAHYYDNEECIQLLESVKVDAMISSVLETGCPGL